MSWKNLTVRRSIAALTSNLDPGFSLLKCEEKALRPKLAAQSTLHSKVAANPRGKRARDAKVFQNRQQQVVQHLSISLERWRQSLVRECESS